MNRTLMRIAGSISKACATVAAVLATAHGTAAEGDPTVSWQPLGPDIEQANTSLNPDSLFSSSVVMVRSSLSRFKLQVIKASDFGWKRAPVRALCRAAGATACVNSNFFDEQGKALGLVISRGIVHQKIHKGGGTLTGVLFVTPKSVGLAHRDAFSPVGVVEATQAGPRVISESTIVPGLKESSFRTNLSGVCLDRNGRVVLYRVTSGVFGASLPLLQRLLLSPSVQCAEALNFDGGGSSQFYISGSIPGHTGATREENFPGTDDVPVVVGLVPVAPPS
jgi:hypothetical protein